MFRFPLLRRGPLALARSFAAQAESQARVSIRWTPSVGGG